MRALAAAALCLLASCQIDLDSAPATTCSINTTSSACVEAASASDFTFIKAKIFDVNCFGSACHEATGTSKLHFSKDVPQATAYANLMSYTSIVDPKYQVIVPGDPAASYMELMIQKIPPAKMSPPASPPPSNIGYMPQASPTLCCQKLDAIDRWIAAGAMND